MVEPPSVRPPKFDSCDSFHHINLHKLDLQVAA
jgi:hypothetical protein